MEKKYVVYQHVTPDGMYYFGVTSNIKNRWNGNGTLYKRTSLQPYIEKYGWDNIQHIILFRDQTKEDALWIEDFLITTAQEDGVCINKQRSGLVSKEEGYKQQHYQQNRDEILEQKQDYYQKNRDEILEQKQEYYKHNKDKRKKYLEENREKILEQRQEYYEKNQNKIREYNRQRYQRKKEEKQLKEFGCLPLW